MDHGEVYVVTDGYYSDRHIVGIYTDKEMADRSMALEGREAEVEVFTLNPSGEELRQGLTAFEIQMTRTGLVIKSEAVAPSWIFNERVISPPRDDFGVAFLRTYVWAKDAEHAVKIANERRSRLIASNQWETENDDN